MDAVLFFLLGVVVGVLSLAALYCIQKARSWGRRRFTGEWR